MEFFTYSDTPRPVRLCEETRHFAKDSLEHKYGLDTLKVPAIALDAIDVVESMTPYELYDLAILEIAKNAPLRICKNERLTGAATLGLAVGHKVPATLGGKPIFDSISHLTVDFQTVLKRGIEGIEQDVEKARLREELTLEQKEFLKSCENCLAAFRIWHGRYLAALEGREEFSKNLKNLKKVPLKPAENFYEAVQSVWFTFAFLRLCGNWTGIGTVDRMWGEFLRRDLESSSITLDEAREILAHFFIKGCEWICGDECWGGDSQHYQNIVLAGTDSKGKEIANEVTYLVLDVLEEFNIGDFPTSIRLHKDSPEKLLRRVAEVMKHGGGALAVYNEETVLSAMEAVGYDHREAVQFANDGCWEMQIPGKTNFFYIPFDGLTLLLNDTLRLNSTPRDFQSFDQLKECFFENLRTKVDEIYSCCFKADGHPHLGGSAPNTAVSLFEEGCIENAVSYSDGGAVYFVRSPHLGGLADIGNSLRVIDLLCFKEKQMDFRQFMTILKNNWEGDEPLRQFVLNRVTLYGNDDDIADAYTAEVADRFAELVLSHKTAKNTFFVPGISTFGRQVEWCGRRLATPHGHRMGEILAPNAGATPGTDLKGATALIKSYCKLKLKNQTTGAALDLKLLPSAVGLNEGIEVLSSLMRGFVALGGCFMQPDIVDRSILKKAQENPQAYASLSVRVSGWNARFVTLDRQWQEMCIAQTEHGGGI